MNFETLKQRADFLHVKGGARWVTPGFTLQVRRARGSERPKGSGERDKRAVPTDERYEHEGARVGFTVTKRIGNAVIRNRIKRRLREIVGIDAMLLSRSHVDYVLNARQGVEKRGFEDLSKDFKLALRRVHGKLKPKPGESNSGDTTLR